MIESLSKTTAPRQNKLGISESEEEIRSATFRAMGIALPGDEIDEALPRLVNLNQDPLFSECLTYYIKDGITLLGR